MERPLRIAVIGSPDERLAGELRQLPQRPEVHLLSSLVADTEALLRWQPDVLFVQFGLDADEDVGAVRLLQRLWPGLRVALICSPDGEVATAPMARRLAAQVLVYPDTPGRIAAVLERMLQDSDRPSPELFIDLAHGLADEINNPLLFVSGHLQLLRAQFGNESDVERDRRDQVDAALAGLQRIQASVDRLRLLSDAADGPKKDEEVDLAEVVTHAVSKREPGQPAATIDVLAGPQTVRGDRTQLVLAGEALIAFADELAALCGDSHLSLTESESSRRLRLVARGQALASWQLPNTFEPFYPQRIVRGRSHGLGLFLLQTIVLGHHGQATVRRRNDGAVQFDFLLPT
ncbi:MAG: sensor histidine kinase [Planctomycetota bacterium]